VIRSRVRVPLFFVTTQNWVVVDHFRQIKDASAFSCLFFFFNSTLLCWRPLACWWCQHLVADLHKRWEHKTICNFSKCTFFNVRTSGCFVSTSFPELRRWRLRLSSVYDARLGFLFRWDMSVICPVIVLKLSFHIWQNSLNYFQWFQNKFGVWPKNDRKKKKQTRGTTNTVSTWHVHSSVARAPPHGACTPPWRATSPHNTRIEKNTLRDKNEIRTPVPSFERSWSCLSSKPSLGLVKVKTGLGLAANFYAALVFHPPPPFFGNLVWTPNTNI